jgi:hypothetical protein
MPLSHYPMKKRSVRPMRLRAACKASGSAVVASLQISAPPLSGVFITVAFPQPRVAHASGFDISKSLRNDDTMVAIPATKMTLLAARKLSKPKSPKVTM